MCQWHLTGRGFKKEPGLTCGATVAGAGIATSAGGLRSGADGRRGAGANLACGLTSGAVGASDLGEATRVDGGSGDLVRGPGKSH